jgi:hypothetical protein
MITLVTAMNVGIIHKHIKELISPTFEHFSHCTWKNVCYVLKPKWHKIPFKKAKLGDDNNLSNIFI